MTSFDAYDSMMEIATTCTSGAEYILPPVIPITIQFGLAKGSPANLETASQKWDEAVAAIERTASELRASVENIAAQDWDADDRRLYEAKVGEFLAQLDVMHTFCTAVSMALIVYAWALFVYAIFAVSMGIAIAILAVTAAAAAAGVITAEATVVCEEIAATFLVITLVATGILVTAAGLAAVVFQGGSLVTAMQESRLGNDQAFNDFMTAEMNGSATALANLGQNMVNASLSAAKGESPLSEVDFDADRDADNTWTVGGGATFTSGDFEGTVNGHLQFGDEGFQGGDVTLSGKHEPSGASAELSAGYTDPDGVGQGEAGQLTYGAKAGVSTPGSVSGYTAGVSGEHDFGTGQGKIEGYGGTQQLGKDDDKTTYGYEYDGQGGGSTTYKHETPDGTDETPPWDK
ncbi:MULTISPECIES: hypothetical protein [Thermomonosporaceae]|uniref:hypothetical protein n=1 Tax=Thermomonosporaceae TaxID=2012 RepID=UPI00255AC905|nr:MULTISPECIES: hypothetical protein [Thermomonosporaceae]MDL4772870.1 hypothetical protein [Actinomadura xylanilytica]